MHRISVRLSPIELKELRHSFNATQICNSLLRTVGLRPATPRTMRGIATTRAMSTTTTFTMGSLRFPFSN